MIKNAFTSKLFVSRISCASILLFCFAAAARPDTLVQVTSQSGQGSNDSVSWSKLGADQTTLAATFNVASGAAATVGVTLAGPSSVVSVACAATPCSWNAGGGFAAGDSLLWASNAANGGNGPAKLTFSKGISGAGALIQANVPGAFTAQIQAFNGATSLGTFTANSTNGNAVYIGLTDQTGANITSVQFSLTACGATNLGTDDCNDFALDTVYLNTGGATTGTPSLVSASPKPASGLSPTFALTYGDTAGTGNLSFVGVIFNYVINGANACYVAYYPGSNTVYLENDGGTAFTGPMTPGSGTLSNSQCTITGSGTSVTKSGNNLTLNLAVTASSTSTGKKNVYMSATDKGGASVSWTNEGTWTPAANQAPTVVSASPTPASGLSNTFALTYSDPNGSNDIQFAGAILNYSVTGVNSCYVSYYPGNNRIYLENDAGTAFTGPITIGSSGTLSNSQCTITGSSSSVTRSGNNLTLNLAVTASSVYTGLKNIFMSVTDNGAASVGWTNKGTWSPAANSAPTVTSVTPNPASGLTNTFVLKYSDANGNSDLNDVTVNFNSTTSAANGCYVYYLPSTKRLYLENDAGNGLTGPITLGSGTLSNNQCTISGSGSSVVTSGNNLTLNLKVTASGTFTGAKNVYMTATDNSNASSGAVNAGSWTP